MKLPDWRECSWRVARGYDCTALEKFIFKFEPVNDEEKDEWRDLLLKAVEGELQSFVEKVENMLKGEENG